MPFVLIFYFYLMDILKITNKINHFTGLVFSYLFFSAHVSWVSICLDPSSIVIISPNQQSQPLFVILCSHSFHSPSGNIPETTGQKITPGAPFVGLFTIYISKNFNCDTISMWVHVCMHAYKHVYNTYTFIHIFAHWLEAHYQGLIVNNLNVAFSHILFSFFRVTVEVLHVCVLMLHIIS